MYKFKLTTREQTIIDNLSQMLQIRINRKHLYIVALTHKSYFNKLKNLNRRIYSYEKLEFLGDAILQFIVTNILFRKFPKQSEGELSALRAYLVKESTLASVVKELEISSLIQTGRSFKNKVHTSDHVLSDVYESLVAAIYLDRGIKQTQNFILRTLINKYNLQSILNEKSYLDPKTQIQEIIQKIYGITPVYETIIINKSDLEKYVSYVKINHTVVAKGTGTTKIDAEFTAAAKALKYLNNIIKKLDVKNKINKNGKKA